MKRMMFGLLIIMTLMGGSACMKKENINDMAIKYMEQKYGETFEYYAPYGGSTPKTREFLVTCSGYPEEKVCIAIENYNSEDRIYRDNYLAIKYKEKTREFFTECVGRCFDEFKILYSPSYGTQSPTLSADATFEEYLNDTRACITCNVVVKESAFNDDEKALLDLGESISKKAKRFVLDVFVVSDEDYKDTWNTPQEFFSRRYSLVKRVQISNSNSDFELEMEWIREK